LMAGKPTRRRREATDIDQHVYTRFEEVGIPRSHVRRDIATMASGRQRGDLWVSRSPDESANFEDKIVALIECKDQFTTLLDLDWQDAMEQGRKKAGKQGLRAFFVTNTKGITRCYSSSDMSEVSINGQLVTEIPALPAMVAVQTQVRPGVSNVTYPVNRTGAGPDPNQFRMSLWTLRQIYRAAGISKGSEASMIKTTLTFCILKLISEQQSRRRTIPNTILLWDDWRKGQMDRDIRASIEDLTGQPSLAHLKDALSVSRKLTASQCAEIYDEISGYTLYGSDFNFFGLVYEALANPEIKSDFGEFYTPRHLIKTIVRLRLKNEAQPRRLSVCDPACGTGGFLVEAFLLLQEHYRNSRLLNDEVLRDLKENTFHGFDTNGEVAVPFARTNMMMADDGGTNIRTTADSLVELRQDSYDYILANIPYGRYSGRAPLNNFVYARHRRYELLFLEKIVQALRPGGAGAVIVPDGLVENISYDTYRQRLLLDVTMEAVLSLHTSVFEPYTTEKTYVLIFTKRRQAERGQLQKKPIWHYIVDNDGFQKGKKRYPILENDLEEVQRGYLSLNRPGKCGFVAMSEVSSESFYSLSSEYHLRRTRPIEISATHFEKFLSQAEKILGAINA